MSDIRSDQSQKSYLDYELSPEVNLWLIVLWQGIRRAAKGEGREIAWVYNNESERPGSFVWICESLQLSVSKIRRLLRQYRHQIDIVNNDHASRFITSHNLTTNMKNKHIIK